MYLALVKEPRPPKKAGLVELGRSAREFYLISGDLVSKTDMDICHVIFEFQMGPEWGGYVNE